MKNLFFFLLGAIVISGYSCDTKKSQPKKANEILGLASPIVLKLDSTEVRLQDYFLDVSSIVDATISGLESKLSSNKQSLWVYGELENQLSFLNVKTNTSDYQIPVFSSSLVKTSMKIPANMLKGESVKVKGGFNGWNPSANEFNLVDGNWVTHMTVNRGTYEYKLLVDGEEVSDPINSITVPNGFGGNNNIFQVGGIPRANHLGSSMFNEASVHFEADFELDNAIAFVGNQKVEVFIMENKIEVKIPSWCSTEEKSTLRVWAESDGQRTNDVIVPLQRGKVVTNSEGFSRDEMRKAIIYFVMLDRFYDGNKENNFPVDDPRILPQANNLGGDMKGLAEKVNSGYFSDLGINTLWLSPITTNPDSAYGLWNQEVTSKFSGYHGYWPVRSKEIDYRLGSEESFKSLLDNAHSREMNVLLDYVANHVHVEHPVYKNHPDWATDLYLPDGIMNTEKWDEHRLTTWFDTHLATLDLSKPEVAEHMTDTALYWLTQYELDGFRHDATKHIPENFWRLLTHKIKSQVVNDLNRSIYQVGETYGSPELISSYVESGQLDAQFDFNLYDAAVDAFAKEETGFQNLKRVLNESLKYYGAHHTMVNITGNQDRARFTSYADGSVKFNEDAKLAGWTREINNEGEEGFKRMRMLTAFIHSVPGIPCVYYGDELAMPGGNDPDNRRMMVFSDLNPSQLETKENLKNLTGLRNSNLPLIYGSTVVQEASDNMFRITRKYFNQEIQFIFYKGDEELEFSIPKNDLPKITILQAEDCTNREEDDKTVFTMKPWSFVILRTEK